MTDLRRLPNLPALRAFEAAARYQNFSRAASEIHVTHGAISHQVRALEEELGVSLFSRNGKRLTITPDGERFAVVVRQALMDIAHAADTLKASARQKRLTITALPSFAARWLAPRLGRFIEQHPDTEVMLQSSGYLTDFAREAVDVGVRFGSGHYPGLSSELVMHDYYYPAASPKFNGGRLPRTPQEIARGTLLRCEHEPWVPWFRLAGLELEQEPVGGLVFQDSSILVRAAVDGQGVALVRHVIAAQDVEAGNLVRLSEIALQSPFSYYLVCPTGALQKPQVQAFRAWLFDEVEKTAVRQTTVRP
ncbi:MAG TPA: transcriptional regulator GcvA [Burkholderiaceae bacterium]|jgi:LysR family glycine cleavage system transcriptional activator|nr:transcriptional regulator GcvA [Burkholderiaceae bacterium]